MKDHDYREYRIGTARNGYLLSIWATPQYDVNMVAEQLSIWPTVAEATVEIMRLEGERKEKQTT